MRVLNVNILGLKMGDKEDSQVVVSIGDTELLKLWFHEGRGTGGQMGISLMGYHRNVHLTTFVKDNVLHYHLKDEDAIVWEDEITIDETMKIAVEFFESIIKPYSPNQTYHRFSDAIADEMRGRGNLVSDGRFDWDMKPLLVASVQVRPMERRKTTILKGFQDNEHPGMIWKFDDGFIIIPFSENEMAKVNMDILKTPISKHPAIRGWFELFEYFDRELILEKAGLVSPEKKRMLKSEIDGLLMNSILQEDGKVG